MPKKNTPLVSIIMPVYNAEKYVEKSINSVLNQQYDNWELLIINDSSSDNSKEIIEKYQRKDNRITAIYLPLNKGVVNARNIGIEKANGRFLAFLDSDDMWHERKLDKQINYMLQNDVSFSYTKYQEIQEDGTFTKKIIKVKSKPIDFSRLLRMNYFGCLTVVLDLHKINKPYFPEMKHEDYALWLSILKENNIKAYGIDETLAYYRITPGSISRNKLRGILWSWKIYRNHLGENMAKAIYRMLIFSINIAVKYIKSRTV